MVRSRDGWRHRRAGAAGLRDGAADADAALRPRRQDEHRIPGGRNPLQHGIARRAHQERLRRRRRYSPRLGTQARRWFVDAVLTLVERLSGLLRASSSMRLSHYIGGDFMSNIKKNAFARVAAAMLAASTAMVVTSVAAQTAQVATTATA